MSRHETNPTEDTQPGVRSAMQDVSSEMGIPPAADGRSPIAELAAELVKHGGGNGNGSPPDMAKLLKRNRWIIGLLVAVLGPGGVFGAYYVTKALAETNEHRIEHNEVRIDANSKGIGEIKVHVDKLDTTIGEQTKIQGEIKQGIDELKQEKVDELKAKLERAERENRILRRSQ